MSGYGAARSASGNTGRYGMTTDDEVEPGHLVDENGAEVDEFGEPVQPDRFVYSPDYRAVPRRDQ